MKRLLGVFLMTVLVFTACEGPMGPPGKDGESTQWFIQDFEIFSEDWKPVSDDLMGNIFVYEFSFPRLTNFIFSEGAVVCHLLHVVNGVTVQTPLPYTFYGEYDGFLYSENYTYEYRPGRINFLVKVSDFDTGFQKPLDCTFRVVLMW